MANLKDVPSEASPGDGNYYFSYDIHAGGSNAAFVDGDVKWREKSQGKNWIFDISIPGHLTVSLLV